MMFKGGLICSIVVFLGLGCGGGQVVEPEAKEVAEEPVSEGGAPVDAREEEVKQVVTVIGLVGSASVGSVVVKLEVKNGTDAPFEFCKYQTPFEKTLTSGLVFQVLGVDGAELEYGGVMVKRSPPSREKGDYVTLAPNESAFAEMDLASSYGFEPGEYRLRFMGNDMNLLPSSNEILFSVK